MREPIDWQEHRGLVRLWANRILPKARRYGVEYEDLVPVGDAKLWQILGPRSTYDGDRSAVSTYVMRCLEKYTWRAIAIAAGHSTEVQMNNYTHRVVRSMDEKAVTGRFYHDYDWAASNHEIIGDNGQPPGNAAEHLDEIAFIMQKAGLRDNEIDIVGMWMHGMNRQQIADSMGITRNSAAYHLRESLRRLRAAAVENSEETFTSDIGAVQCEAVVHVVVRPMRSLILPVGDRGVSDPIPNEPKGDHLPHEGQDSSDRRKSCTRVERFALAF